MSHLVLDVQILMIASGKSDPADDGTAIGLLREIRECLSARLVWDTGGLIRGQYEQKLKEQTFARQWLEELVLANRVLSVKRRQLTRKQRLEIEETGLVGEDLNYYVRTSASSPDKALVSHDTDYDQATCLALRKQLGVIIRSAAEGTAHLQASEAT